MAGLQREPAAAEVVANGRAVTGADLVGREELERSAEGVADREPQQRPDRTVEHSWDFGEVVTSTVQVATERGYLTCRDRGIDGERASGLRRR